MPDAKRGLTISISWDIKKESVLRRETVCPPKGRRERLPWSAQREDAKLKQKETAIMDTFEKIRALLAEQLDIDPAKITMDSDIMGDFEADSLDIVDMVMTLEDEFGIEVPDDAIENLRFIYGFVRNDERLAHGLGRIRLKWQKTTKSSYRRSPVRRRTSHSGIPTSASRQNWSSIPA